MNRHGQVNGQMNHWPGHLNPRFNGGYEYTPEEQQMMRNLADSGRLGTDYVQYSREIENITQIYRRALNAPQINVASCALSSKRISMGPPLELITAQYRRDVNRIILSVIALERQRLAKSVV